MNQTELKNKLMMVSSDQQTMSEERDKLKSELSITRKAMNE